MPAPGLSPAAARGAGVHLAAARGLLLLNPPTHPPPDRRRSHLAVHVEAVVVGDALPAARRVRVGRLKKLLLDVGPVWVWLSVRRCQTHGCGRTYRCEVGRLLNRPGTRAAQPQAARAVGTLWLQRIRSGDRARLAKARTGDRVEPVGGVFSGWPRNSVCWPPFPLRANLRRKVVVACCYCKQPRQGALDTSEAAGEEAELAESPTINLLEDRTSLRNNATHPPRQWSYHSRQRQRRSK